MTLDSNIEPLEINMEYFAELMKSTVAYDFYPVSEYALTLYGFPALGYPLPPEIEHKAKKILSDVDGVWNTQQIFAVYIKLLSELNDGIKARQGKIFERAKELRPGNVDGPVEEIEEYFIESNVTCKQHHQVCAAVPRHIGLQPNSIQCLLEMKRMYYDIEFFSGSPELAVKHFVGKNMGLAGFDMKTAEECVTGTKYLFDEDGFIVEIRPMLYEYKKEAVENRLKETVGTTKGINVVLSDEPGDVHMVQSFINPFILTGNVATAELPTDVSIALPEASKNMMLIPPVIRKAEMGLCFALGYPKNIQKKILKSAFKLRKTCELIESTDKNPRRLRDKALAVFNDYTSLTSKLFTTSPGFTGIGGLVRELQNAKSKDEIKLSASKLLEKFRKYSPHPDSSEELLKHF